MNKNSDMKNISLGKSFFMMGALVVGVVLFSIPGSARAQAVLPDPPALPDIPSAPVAPVLTFSALPESISFGDSAVLSWDAPGAASCVAGGGWSGTKAATGSESVSPTSDTVFSMECFDVFHLVSSRQEVFVAVVENPDTTAPTKPAGLSGTVVLSSGVNLSWTASTDPTVTGQETSGVVQYRIERCQGSGCTDFVERGMSSGTTYSDTGLSVSTTYRYRVLAVDGAGNVSIPSSILSKTTGSLAKPTGLSASAVSTSQIDLSWTGSSDANVVLYEIERCQGSNCSNFVQIGTTSGTTYSSTGLSANTTYRYRIRASDDAGHVSSYSSIVSKKTPVN